MSIKQVELGLDTFGDVTVDENGERTSYPQVIRDVIEEAVLADSVGVDFFGVGEHHRDDFSISSPDMVLAAIAGQTERIRLGTAVTVLSSDDAVRVYASEEVARQFVATPERSHHVTGNAVDIGNLDAQLWLQQHGAQWGLCQIYANERWHFEIATTPGGTCPAQLPDAAG